MCFFSSSSSSSPSPPILMSSSPPIDFRSYYSGKGEDLQHHIRRAYRLHGIYDMLKFTQTFPANAAALDLFIHSFDPNEEFYDHLFTNRRGWFPFYWDDECLDPDKFRAALDAFLNLEDFEDFWRHDNVRHRKRLCVGRQERHAKLLAARVLRTGFSFVLKLFQSFQGLRSSSPSRSRSRSVGHSRGRRRHRSRREPNAPNTIMASSLNDLRRAYRSGEKDLCRHLRKAYRLHHIYDMLKFTQSFPHEAAKLRLFIETFDPDREHYASLFTNRGRQPFEGDDECLEPEVFTEALEEFLEMEHFDYFWQDDTIQHRGQAYVAEQEEVKERPFQQPCKAIAQPKPSQTPAISQITTSAS
ncbi:hypothetical protein BC567DRAFT_213429 [Phyllosticta citribraziliensis]